MYVFVTLGYELEGLDKGKQVQNRNVWGSEGPLVDEAVSLMICCRVIQNSVYFRIIIDFGVF